MDRTRGAQHQPRSTLYTRLRRFRRLPPCTDLLPRPGASTFSRTSLTLIEPSEPVAALEILREGDLIAFSEVPLPASHNAPSR